MKRSGKAGDPAPTRDQYADIDHNQTNKDQWKSTIEQIHRAQTDAPDRHGRHPVWLGHRAAEIVFAGETGTECPDIGC